jgi:uncharacterized protein with HEPN domain
MSKRTPGLLLEDILESISKIRQYTNGMNFEIFCADSKTIDAVIRNFEIIGEAANRLPDSIKDKYHTVDWFRIRGFRNRIVHDYMGIDYQTVWLIKENYLDQLEVQIRNILTENGLI